MGQMKLDSLTMRNFKGTRLFTLQAGCVDTQVWGDNATGKTTIADSLNWLLNDKDSLGQAQFEIFPIGTVGTEHKPLEAEVEGVFVNGAEVKLKKVYLESWTQKRGEPRKEKTGHTTKYWIDDVPCKKGEYQEKVAALTSKADLFLLLTNPNHFASLKWETKRSMIIDMVGDITDADVVASVPELKTLPQILGNKSCEDYKKIVAGKRKEIKEKLAGIPGRIDEQDRSKPELEKTNALFFVDTLTKLRAKLNDKNTEIAGISNGGGLVELKLKLADINADIQKIRTESQEKNNASTQVKKDELNSLKDGSAEQKRVLRDLVRAKAEAEVDLAHLKEVNGSLAIQWNEKSVSLFVAEACVTCGKPMTEEEAEVARATYNQAKAVALEKIQITANTNKAKAVTIKDLIATKTDAIAVCEKNIVDTEKLIASAENSIAENCLSLSPLEASPEYIKAQDLKTKTEKEISEYQAGNTALTETAVEEAKAIQVEIEVAEKSLSLIEQVQKADIRIAELAAEEKQLSGAFEVLEGHLYLIELFVRTKVSMLDDKINSKFELVQFRMFRDQVNGGLQEVCDITVNNVPYGSLNTGARCQAGLDIIKTFSRFHDFHPMIFVDGKESVTSLPDMDAQIISLVVSEPDKVLRVVQ